MIDFIKRCYFKHPIWTSLAGIFLSFVLLGILSIFFLDLWTHHGSTTRVPDVVGMPLEEAIDELKEADLDIVISDSVYTKGKMPGSVVDIIPEPNSIVKSGREVYLTIVAFSPEPVIIDMLLIDSSAKQAEAYLKARGLRVERRYVPYEYNDIVIGVKCNGRNISVGSKVTIDDLIILEVGRVTRQIADVMDELDQQIDAQSFFESGSEEDGYENEDLSISGTESEPDELSVDD